MRDSPIIISDGDILRLRGLLGAVHGAVALDHAHLGELRTELERAIVLPVHEVPDGVVTMGARVQVRNLLNDRIEGYQLVYPREADPAAHRLSVLQHVDQISVLASGRITEQGRHAALLARDGAYAALWRTQKLDSITACPASEG